MSTLFLGFRIRIFLLPYVICPSNPRLVELRNPSLGHKSIIYFPPYHSYYIRMTWPMTSLAIAKWEVHQNITLILYHAIKVGNLDIIIWFGIQSIYYVSEVSDKGVAKTLVKILNIKTFFLFWDCWANVWVVLRFLELKVGVRILL